MHHPFLRRILTCLCSLLVCGLASAQTNTAAPPVLKATTALTAWAELADATHATKTPPEWDQTPPTEAEKHLYFSPFVHGLADGYRAFYNKYPTDSSAPQARIEELKLLTVLQQWGQTNLQARADSARQALASQTGLSRQDHLNALWLAAQNSPPEKARPMLLEILAQTDSEELHRNAASLLQTTYIGQPLNLQFTAVDGRPVDLAKMKGKVVLIDFWATWCGPCVAELPDVKSAYDKQHAAGFEIVGISLDKEKSRLTEFTSSHQMEWPQYFDGLFWRNHYALQFGVESIPAMWLVDRKGILRDVQAREDLSGKVEKMLAEQ